MMSFWKVENQALIIINHKNGGLAQLARAPALHAGGQRFESVILHQTFITKSQTIIDMLANQNNRYTKGYWKESREGRTEDA